MKRDVKILHLITSLDTGGAQTMLLKLLKNIDAERFENIVVSMVKGGAMEEEFKKSGIIIRSLNMKKGLPSLLGPLEFIKIMKTEKPAVFHTWLYHANILGFLYKIVFKGLPLIWGIRSTVKKRKDYSFLTIFLMNLGARLSPFVDRILFNSKIGMETHCVIGYKGKMEIVPNGFDLAYFTKKNDEQVRELKWNFQLKDDYLVIGVVSRFHKEKGYDIFVKSAALVTQKHKNLQFVMVGEGFEHANKELCQLIENEGLTERVILLGERDDVGLIYPIFDIFTSPSYGEGFPNALGEAMASCVPSVATTVGDCASILGDAGILIPPDDPEAMCGAWCEIIEMGPVKRQAMGLKGRKIIKKRYDIKKVASTYEKIFQELSNGKKT